MIAGTLHPFAGKSPKLGAGVFIAAGARLIGDVELGADANVWFNCVLRGDVQIIRVGARTNIQDGTVVHVSTDSYATHIGADVMVAHMALLHGCTLEDRCMVGMHATVMDGVVVETGAMVAAGALVTPGKRVRAGQLWAGSPAKHMRDLFQREIDFIAWGPGHYVELAKKYRAEASGGGAPE